MAARRLKELVAIALVGDGVVGLAAPRRHSLLWDFGPWWYRKTLEALAGRPNLVRALAGVEALGGLWLALRQYPEERG